MIIVEIRNDELRAIKVKRNRHATVVEKSNTKEVPFEALSDLMSGKTIAMSDILHELLVGLDLGDYKRYKFSVVMNLEGIMTQRVSIPKVKDKAMIYSVSSALQKDNVILSQDNLITYAVLKDKEDKKSKMYNIMAYILDKEIAKHIVSIFDDLKIDFENLDLGPNTLFKAYKANSMYKSVKPLTLIVDLSEEDVKYYQFKDKAFHMSYLERVSSKGLDYVKSFEVNVYQFLDEFSEFTLNDIDILLLGDQSSIDKLILNFEGILNLNVFFDTLPTFDTRKIDNESKFVTLLGVLLRYDTLLSSHAKYDINVLKELNKSKSGKNSNGLRNVISVGTLLVILGTGYLIGLNISNNKQIDNNTEILEYVESPGVLENVREKEKLSGELKVYDEVLSSLNIIERYLIENKMPYNSRIYYSITQDVPLRGGSRVNKLVYTNGTIEIDYETLDETTFKDYLVLLGENKLINTVDYSGYSSSGAGYSGKITVKLKRGGE